MSLCDTDTIYLFSSSGRSGSRFLNRVLSLSGVGIPCFHEFGIDFLKPIIVSYLDGIVDRSFLIKELTRTFSMVKDPFVDCSYIYSYIPDIISELDVGFNILHCHISRHPVDVISSWFLKLSDEIYPNTVSSAADLPDRSKFWPSIPNWLLSNQNSLFEQICYHYISTNMPIISYNNLFSDKLIPLIKFESLLQDPSKTSFPERLLPYYMSSQYDLTRPLNIHKRSPRRLTDDELLTIDHICSFVSCSLGYSL